ncbi:MAG TPA: MmgE/PrpD family protein [Acetobacteraceae bacterium]|nr:MmgE/PrpD family protein [Acetobacteraceae bacterium]
MAFAPEQITARLADFAVNTQPAQWPDAVHREALRSFFNVFGCTIGGAQHEMVEVADQTLGAFAGPAQATLLARGRRADILHASLINGLASSIYSFDDTHETAVVHPAGPIAAAVLALAEYRPVSGADLLAAFALGVEMTCRLCLGTTVAPADGSFAWSGTGISMSFGAAVAAGRLLGLDVQKMRVAMGLALSEAGGFRAMHGTAAVSFMPAHGGQMGLRAALLAARGFTAGLSALEGKSGYLSVFCTTPYLDALAGGLGQRFEVLRNTYKAYPCGIVIQPIIDACLKLREDHRPAPDRIAGVAIQASPGAMALCNNRNPQDEMQAHVSLHHWTAVALIRGTARIKDMETETAVKSPELMAFQSKVEATLNPALAADQTEVTITMNDGATHVCRIEHGIGSKLNPMSNADLERKFFGLAEPVIGAARTREVIEQTWNLSALADAGSLARAAA